MPPENFEKYQQFLAERGKEPTASQGTSDHLTVSQAHTFSDGSRLKLVASIFFLIAVELALVFAIPYASRIIPMIMVVFGVMMLLMMGKLSQNSR